MKTLSLLLMTLLSLNSFSHCPIDFTEVDLCADIQWIDGPHDGAVSQFKLMFWKKGDQFHAPISPDFEVDIYAWMTMDNGHNHGGPQMTYKEISEGVFEVNDARFFMHGMRGYWEVRTELIDENGNTVSMGAQKVPLNGNGGGHQH